jgi:hypothetical protein
MCGWAAAHAICGSGWVSASEPPCKGDNAPMSRQGARDILAHRVAQLRQESYESLRAKWLDRPDCEQVFGDSGKEYGVEVQAFWDDPRDPGNLRVVVSVGDSLLPPTDGFIVAPDGTFVGE